MEDFLQDQEEEEEVEEAVEEEVEEVEDYLTGTWRPHLRCLTRSPPQYHPPLVYILKRS